MAKRSFPAWWAIAPISSSIPELVAQRLLRYADLVGKENLQAGTDCGLGERVGHAEIVWAKFRRCETAAESRPLSSGAD